MNEALEFDSHPYLARIVARQLSKDSEADLVFTEKVFWLYNGKIWEPLCSETVRLAAIDLDRHPVIRGKDPQSGELLCRPLKANYHLVEGIASTLKVLFGARQQDFFQKAPFGLQFNNGFVTVDLDGQVTLRPSSPSWRQRILMPWDWDINAQAPRWEQALDQWFRVCPANGQEVPFDPDTDALHKRMFLQEFAGASLLGLATRYGKATILTGHGENGKSKFIEAIQNAFPEGAWTTLEPQTLGEEYRAAELAGKRINFSADIPSTELVSSHVFKAAVTGDAIMGRHIRQDPFKFKPEAGHLFSANELPPTRDYSHGFWRRFVVIEFANKFMGKDKDPHLADKLHQEIPGIVAWMVRGARRLLKNGQYTIPASSNALLDAWRTDSDVVARWLEEATQPVEHFSLGTPPNVLFEHFDTWRARRRYKDITETAFYKRLAQLIGQTQHQGNSRRHLRRLS